MSAAAFVVLDAVVLGPMRRNLARTTLAVLAIALGIALGSSIYLINRSAADEISLAARSLYGLADLSVESVGEILQDTLYPSIARLPGIAVASPEIEIEARLADRPRASIKLIGVDAFRYAEMQPAIARTGKDSDVALELLNPSSVFLSATAARELGLSKGEVLNVQVGLRVEPLEIAGVLPANVLRESAGLIDIATAQWKFDRLGRLSRINLRLKSGVSLQQIKSSLQQLQQGQALRITTPGEATDDALRLSRAYRANLTALALVALFTGGFLVYSTQALMALRRRREFAILHALGVTRPQQLWLNLSATAVLGLIGSSIGIALGVLLANVGLETLGQAVGAGYFSQNAAPVNLHPVEIALFAAVGMLVALAGALRPSLEASKVSTAAALKAGDVLSAYSPANPVALTLGFLLGIAVLLVPPIAGLPLPGYVSIAILLIATVAAMPAFIRAVLKIRPKTHFVAYEIAIAELAGTARYAALSVSAIVVSFSLMVAMAIMVSSFRTSLDEWTQKMLPADLYLRVGYVGQSAHMDESLARSLATLSGVSRIEVSRLSEASLNPELPPVVLIARSFDVDAIEDSLWITAKATARAPDDTTPIWVSEAAADLFDLAAGDLIEMQVGEARLETFVQGLWRDYEHQNGAVLIQRDTYTRLNGDRAINTIWFWLSEDASLRSVRDALVANLPPGIQYDIRQPGEIRQLSLRAFDRTFAITYVLEIVAVAIGLFGIAAGISAQVLARRGEFGALRHIGFTRGQIGGMLAIEGSVLGAMGVLAGLAMGVVVSLILIYIVNRQSFHWSMDLHAPVSLLTSLALALVACSALIALLSGRQAMGVDVVRAVKEDW